MVTASLRMAIAGTVVVCLAGPALGQDLLAASQGSGTVALTAEGPDDRSGTARDFTVNLGGGAA